MALFLIGALASLAAGYTLVLRDGRRVEVPSQFTLTRNTLTYETARGINVTLLLAVVDIAATERANKEVSGDFFKHVAPAPVAATISQTRRAQFTVTNQELEPTRRARVESERLYEQRRIELGLPSVEESRRRQAQAEQEVLELARDRDRVRVGAESYWRERAGILRNEIVAADAEISFVRSRLGEFYQFPLATRSLVTGVGPLATRSGAVPRVGNPGVFVAPRPGPQIRGRVVFGGGAVRGQARINPSRSLFRSGPVIGGFGFPSFTTAGPFDSVESSYERAGLVERLNDLLVARAGLSARWQELENEARDARVPQVWLEP